MEDRCVDGLFRHGKGVLTGMPQHLRLRIDIADQCLLVMAAHQFQHAKDGVQTQAAGTDDISF